MSAKKDNLPTNVDVDLENGGTIKYANEVIAIIAGVAASEIDGIAGMCTSGGISDIIGRNRNITRGVKVEVGGEEASVELYIIVEYGSPIQKVASDVQENVRKAIETMTGLHVVNVDVHVQGVSFEREKEAVQSGLESAHLSSEETRRIEEETRQTLKGEMTREDEIQPETDDQPAADETEDALDGTEAENVKAVEQDEEKQTEAAAAESEEN